MDACLSFFADYTNTNADEGQITYIFAGSYYYTFVNFMLTDEPRNITEHWGVPSPIDAAFQFSYSGRYYLTKGTVLPMLKYSAVTNRVQYHLITLYTSA